MEFLKSVFQFVGSIWFLWVPLVLWYLFFEFWFHYIRTFYRNSIDWVVLEIKIPREIQKTPKAMEQVFANLAATRNEPTNVIEKWWHGEVTLWLSFEIASFGGEIHFFVKAPKKRREVLEANMYAQYPDVDIVEAEDYVDRFPSTTKELYKAGYDIYGTELILGKEDAYPIRTYLQFVSAEETENLDPIAALLEVLGRLKKEEEVWIQFLLRPAPPTWREKGAVLVKKIKEETTRTKGPKDSAMPMLVMRTPGEMKLLEAIEMNIARPGFETLIRFLYIAPKSIFDASLDRSILASLNQYVALGQNYFVYNMKVRTRTIWVKFPFWFPTRRLETRKQVILENYISRRIPQDLFLGKVLTSHLFRFNFASKFYTMNTEGLATIYHLPTSAVLTAPLIKKVESRKVGPPAGLPIFGGSEEEILP